MENILIVLQGFIKMLGFFGIGSLVIIIGLAFIQLISYQVFNFNLFKTINNLLSKEV